MPNTTAYGLYYQFEGETKYSRFNFYGEEIKWEKDPPQKES
jgi:hypothetical protein